MLQNSPSHILCERKLCAKELRLKVNIATSTYACSGKVLTRRVWRSRGLGALARVGGDEFALVATGLANPGEAATISARILSALEAPFEIAGRPLRVTEIGRA